jgi:lysophospholipase L1-like esterase
VTRAALVAALGLLCLGGCSPPTDAAGAAPVPSAAQRAPASVAAPVTRSLPTDRHLLEALGDPARRLLPLLVALEAIETGQSDHPIDIIQLGDSHTANDAFSGRMRELFQERFGAAGRGMLPAGIPFEYFRPKLVTAAETPGWALSSSFRDPNDGPWGLAGTRERGTRPVLTMTLTSTEPVGFGRAAIEVLSRPGAGALDISVDGGKPLVVPTAGSGLHAAWIDVHPAPGSHVLSASPHGDGPVELLAWEVERPGSGVLYENFGTIGATVDVMGRWDRDIVAAEFARRDPALILIAFGTNEGFRRRTDREAYRQLFIDRVRAISAAAPGAAILIIGPPDGNRLFKRAAGQAGSCVPQVAEDAVGVLTAVKQPGRGAVWAPPPGLAKLRQAERQAAAAEHWYFWDWSAAMGGACAMHRWVEADPPLGMADHIHLKADGYRLGAQQLFAELMAQYDRYRSLAQAHPARS